MATSESATSPVRGSQPLRRLKKAGDQGLSAPPTSSDEQLAEELASLSLKKQPQSRFAAKVAARRPVADWSSSESDSEEEGADSASDSSKETLPLQDAETKADKQRKREHTSYVLPSKAKPAPTLRSVSESDQSLEQSRSGHTDGRALVLGEKDEFRLDGEVAKRLYAHQLIGVRWLWSLHMMKRGGILGDDMGLGKTLQCSAFLAGMLSSGLLRRALIVAPKTLLAAWKKELRICGLLHLTHELAPTSGHSEREFALDSVFRSPGVLLTTYGMVQHNASFLCTPPSLRYTEDEDEEKPLWDFMFLDEGHKIKNSKTVINQQLRQIPVAVAVIISGTPIQNNLMELYALFDFVCPGLLGDQNFFRMQYERVITRGNSKDATSRDREMAASRSKALRERYAAYLLRREKKDVLKIDRSMSEATTSGAPAPQQMGRKNDLVVWLRLQPQQRRIYEAFLNSQAVKDVLNQSKSPLAAITVLKKICVHPFLLSERAVDAVAKGGVKLAQGKRVVTEKDFIVDDSDVEYETASSAGSEDSGDSGPRGDGVNANLEDSWMGWAAGEAADQKLRDVLHSTGSTSSCKSLFVAALVKELHATGHRTLIFSQSRVMLDMLGSALDQQRLQFLRIDGTLSAAKREALVQAFQSRDIPVFLLTSQVGGLGLTLTAADRVIIVDPAWNPALDDQSVDRAYRIGQAKDVLVYRLISCGTVEEKIYRKQVFKGGLSRSGMEDGIPFQYFSQQDLRDLFRVDPQELVQSTTQQQLHELHAADRKATPELQAHLDVLQTLPCYSGVSDHDLLYSQKTEDTGTAAETLAAAFPTIGTQTRERAPPRSAKTLGASTVATKGWGGGGDISDMLARSLNLGSQDGSSTAKPPGEGWKEGRITLEPERSGAGVAGLREQLQRLRRLQQSNSLLLPDGGAQLRAKIRDLERRIAAAFKCDASTAPLPGQPQLSSGSGSEAGKPPSASSSGHSALCQPQVIEIDSDDEQDPRAGAPAAVGGDPLASGQQIKESLVQLERRAPLAAIPPPLPHNTHAAVPRPSGHAQRSAEPADPVKMPQKAARSLGPRQQAGAHQAAGAKPKLEELQIEATVSGAAVPSTGALSAGPVADGSQNDPKHALAAALRAPFPDDVTKGASQRTVPSAQAAAADGSDLAQMKRDSAELKDKLRQMVAVLNDPRAKAKLPDGGRQMKQEAKRLEKVRNAIKENISRLQSAQ